MRHFRAGLLVPLPCAGPERRRHKSLFSGPPKPPKPPDPVLMPDLMDPAVMAAQKRQLAGMMSRSGRASTDLTGDEYTSDKLGGR